MHTADNRSISTPLEALKSHEIPGHVTVSAGRNGLPVIRVRTAVSAAEMYLHGAHVTGFEMLGEPPLLFMSAASEFHADQPIRGGVPVIFPWFGGRDGLVAHGFARLAEWELAATSLLPDGSVSLCFHLPADDPFEVTYTVIVGSCLRLELAVINTGDAPFTFENCLHTYFQVGDIHQLQVAGLQGARYVDTLVSADRTEVDETIRFTAETDRIYQDSSATATVIDPALGRSIEVRKSGSKSTVVWNPWVAKSQRMADFGDEEYLRMVCVESGNVREHAITLQPGEQSLMTVELRSRPLGGIQAASAQHG